mmetsp:Transcript_7819/g.22358  ORF Transcript_7819/g.22358 Transcript_7819/m.22358 type:complete len:245 (+) Transcript_7819:2231-2965(+)
MTLTGRLSYCLEIACSTERFRSLVWSTRALSFGLRPRDSLCRPSLLFSTARIISRYLPSWLCFCFRVLMIFSLVREFLKESSLSTSWQVSCPAMEPTELNSSFVSTESASLQKPLCDSPSAKRWPRKALSSHRSSRILCLKPWQQSLDTSPSTTPSSPSSSSDEEEVASAFTASIAPAPEAPTSMSQLSVGSPSPPSSAPPVTSMSQLSVGSPLSPFPGASSKPTMATAASGEALLPSDGRTLS